MNPSLQFCQQPLQYERVEEMYPDMSLPNNFPLAGWEFSLCNTNQYGYECNPGLFPMANDEFSFPAMNLTTSVEETNLIQQFILMDESLSSTPPPLPPTLDHINPKIPIQRLTNVKSNNKTVRSTNKTRTNDPYKLRTPHVVVEKKYRDSLLVGIESLRHELPELNNFREIPKLNKATILRKSTELIQQLKRQNQLLKEENEQLKVAIISLSGGRELLKQLAITGNLTNHTTKFFMSAIACVGFMLSFSSHPLIKPVNHHINTSFILIPRYYIVGFFLLGCYQGSCFIPNIIQYIFPNPLIDTPDEDLTNELLIIDELSPHSTIFTMTLTMIKLSLMILYHLIWYQNNFNSILQSKLSRHTQLTLQIYLTYKEKWLARFLRKFVLVLINLKYYLLINNQELKSQLQMSSAMMFISIIPHYHINLKMVRFFFKKISNHSSNLLQSLAFLNWITDLPYTFQPHFNNSNDVTSLNLINWTINQFYLDQLHNQFITYLQNPQSPPKSLAPVLQIIMLDPLIHPHCPGLLNVVYLEAALALTCQPDYAIKLTFSLIRHYIKFPHLHPESHSNFLRGLLGCCLALPGPYQSLPSAYYFLTTYLHLPNLSVSNPTQFFITHIIFTYAFHKVPPTTITSDFNLPHRYWCTPTAYHAKLSGTLKKLQAYLMRSSYDQLQLPRKVNTIWLNYYFNLMIQLSSKFITETTEN